VQDDRCNFATNRGDLRNSFRASELDGFNAYTHHLYGDWAFLDLRGAGSRQSSLDGIACFMLYLEIYLHLARTNHPEFYAKLAAEREWKELVLFFWARAYCLVQATRDIEGLKMDADVALDHVFQSQWLDEIEMLRRQ
jgi:hypothetical protein